MDVLVVNSENERGVEGHPLDSRALTVALDAAAEVTRSSARWSPKAAADRWRAGIKPGRSFSLFAAAPSPDWPAGQSLGTGGRSASGCNGKVTLGPGWTGWVPGPAGAVFDSRGV